MRILLILAGVAAACSNVPFDTTFGLPMDQLKEVALLALKPNLSAPLEACRIDPPSDCNIGETISGQHKYLRSSCAPKLCLDIARKVVNDFTAWADFANNNNITWWLTAGSLLGFYRNGGIMPWDDDIDVSIWDDDLLKLFQSVAKDDKWSLFVHPSKGRTKSPLSSTMLKQYRVGSHANPVLCGAGYPMVDIFPLTQPLQKGDCKVMGRLPPQTNVSKYNDIMPISGFIWNNVTLWIPSRPEAILDSCYANWRTDVVSGRDHATEKMLPHARYELSDPPDVLDLSQLF